MIKLNWEQIDDQHQRVRIHGGWLVKAFENRHVKIYDNSPPVLAEVQVSMCFVPDERGHWQ